MSVHELRKPDWKAAIEDLRRRAERYEQASLRAERAEGYLQRIFAARDTDELYERVQEAEDAMGVVR